MTTPALTQADASAGVWWRSLTPLGLVTVLVGLTGAFVSPFLPVFLNQRIHASALQSSLFLFLTPVAGVAVANAAGRISDRPGGRSRVLLAAATAGIAGYGLYAVLRQYWTLLLVSVTLVAVGSAIVPQIYALGREVVQRTDAARATLGMNTLRMMMSLAWAAGAPLGALVLGLIDFNGLFLATSLLYIAVLGVLITLRRNASRPTAPAAAPTLGLASQSRATLIGVTVAFMVLQAVTSLTVTTMPLFVSVTLHGNLADAGIILGLCAALEVPLMLVFGRLASRWSLHDLILTGGAFGAAYCLAGSLATSVWQVAAAQLLHACFVCCVGGLGISYFQGLLPGTLGRASTLFTNSARMAGMLSGLAFGVVQTHGYRLAYVVSLALCVTGTAVLAAIGYRQRSRTRAPAHT